MALDTTAAAREAQIAVLRRLGPNGRLRLAAEMSESARRIPIEGERRRHPELSEAEATRIVLMRIWGPELGARVPFLAPPGRDVAGIVATVAGLLDRPYIERWVDELGLQEEWQIAQTTDT